MTKTKYIILLIVLPVVLCIGFITMVVLLNRTKPAVESITQTRYFPNNTVIYGWRSIEDERVVYVVCDKNNYHTCTIKEEKYPYTNTTKSCDIPLIVDGTVHRPRAVPFGDNRTILLWENGKLRKEDSGTNVTVSVVHWDGCRKTGNIILNVTQSPFDDDSDFLIRQLRGEVMKIVTYNDTFDIFYKNAKQCGERECKLTMDSEGKTQLVEFMRHDGHAISQIQPIAAHSSAKGYVYSKYQLGAENTDLFLMRPNGSEVQLKPVGRFSLLSVVNETIGVCSRPTPYSSDITCSQYNAEGELRLNFSYRPDVRSHENTTNVYTPFINIYTLPEEGFLLQLIEFDKSKDFSDFKASARPNYFLAKLDATGKEVGRFYFKDYNSRENDAGQIWKNQVKDSYCALVLNNHGGSDRINLASNCFTDAIFST